MSTTSDDNVPQATPQAQAQPATPQAPKGPNIQVKGPPSGITVAGHGFWLLPPDSDGAIWAVFRPDGAYYFFPNDQQKK